MKVFGTETEYFLGSTDEEDIDIDAAQDKAATFDEDQDEDPVTTKKEIDHIYAITGMDPSAWGDGDDTSPVVTSGSDSDKVSPTKAAVQHPSGAIIEHDEAGRFAGGAGGGSATDVANDDDGDYVMGPDGGIVWVPAGSTKPSSPAPVPAAVDRPAPPPSEKPKPKRKPKPKPEESKPEAKPSSSEGTILTHDEVDQSLRGRKTERLIVLDSEGRVLVDKEGSDNDVQFTNEEVASMAGNVSTHNHPTGKTFSEHDIYTGILRAEAGMRVVTDEAKYSVDFAKKIAGMDFNKRLSLVNRIKKVFLATIDEEAKGIQPKINSGELSYDQGVAALQHAAWTKALSKHKIPYTREAW